MGNDNFSYKGHGTNSQVRDNALDVARNDGPAD